MVNYFKDPQKVSVPQVIRLFMMCAQEFSLKIGFLCFARMQHCNATMVQHARIRHFSHYSARFASFHSFCINSVALAFLFIFKLEKM